MTITPSALRRDIYRLLDQVAETGAPLIVERKGRRIRIVREEPPEGRLARLVPHDCIRGDPEDLVHIDWSDRWTP